MRDIWFLINDFMDINYLAPLLIYGKSQGISFKVVIIFEHFTKKNKKEFLRKKTIVLNQPVFDDLDISIFSIAEFRENFKSFNGIIISTSGTILRLKKHISDNHQCRYVILSFFNDKVTPILNAVDLAFISSAKDLEEVSGLNVRIGLPYWDLYSGMQQYDFQHLSPVNIPEDTYNIIIPEIFSYQNWHEDAYRWIQENHKDDCAYIFKHRIKDATLENKNKELERKLGEYSNIYHVYDPFFYTTQKLLKNCDEVLFLSNRTLFIYECAKVGIKCRKAYEKTLDFFHYDPTLIDKYIENKSSLQQEIFSVQEHATEFCFNEIIKLANTPGEQRFNEIENVKVIKLEDLDFSKLNFVKGSPRNRQLFFSQDNKIVVKTWIKNYQWADQLEYGIRVNYYDIKLIPNLYALIKDKEGNNRGYVTTRVRDEQLLINFGKVFSLNTIINLLRRRITIKQAFSRRKYKWNQKALVKLLYELFSRAIKGKKIFTDIDFANLWADKDNYYLFDLENCVEFNWFFGNDSGHPEYIRQIIHRDLFNKRMKALIEKHQLLVPMRIDKEEDISLFWGQFVKINALTNVPHSLESYSDGEIVTCQRTYCFIDDVLSIEVMRLAPESKSPPDV